jgi:hypothetical protein
MRRRIVGFFSSSTHVLAGELQVHFWLVIHTDYSQVYAPANNIDDAALMVISPFQMSVAAL